MTQQLAPAAATAPLLAAKYTVPPTRPTAVIRPRLHSLLLGNAATRLTIVTAPAGWGKTTLLSQWAHDPAERRQVAWVSLDAADDEPTRFWAYVLTALQRVGIGSQALSSLGVPGVDPLTVALPTLLNELESAAVETVLVLDDYHVLSDSRVHEGVEFLLTYLPASVRLVISGRKDPALPLPRLRANGELTEIRMHELSFSVPEAGELVAAVGTVDLDPRTVGGLCERTEGWAAGLQLAALTLRSSPARVAAAGIRGDDGHILDYFSSEVMERLSADQRDLLVRACVLERLSGGLCDAALERSGSADLLAELDRANLFVATLDTHREWYRCHPLLRDALRRELSAADSARVLSRAAEWFQAEGYLEDAVEHRILAGDTSGAAELLRSATPWFLERGPGSILRLAERLPGPDVRSDPRLCLSLASAAALDGQFDRMEPWLNAAELLITENAGLAEWHNLRATMATMRAVFLLSRVDAAGASSHAQKAVELETDPAGPGYALCRHILGTAYLVEERRDEAIPVLAESWRQARAQRLPPLLALQAACSLALALYDGGRFGQAEHVCAQAADAARRVEQAWGDAAAPWIAQLQMIEGRLAHRAGDLVSARQVLRRSVALSRIWGFPTQLVMALTSLAEAELSAGNQGAARRALSEASEIVHSDPVWPFVIRELEEAELRIGRGTGKARRRPGPLVEELTDRELSILRMLPGSASQREIGAALFLSINTVKGYAKSLYRKLDATSRQEAVSRARELDLI